MPSNPMQSRRGFFRAFAVAAGGAAVAATFGGGRSESAHPARVGSAEPAAAGSRHYAQRVPPRPTLAVEDTESPVAHAQRNNVRPSAIPAFRL